METYRETMVKKVRQSQVIVALGLVMLVVSLGQRAVFPNSEMNLKWVGAFGIIALGFGAINLVLYWSASKDPAAARRRVAEESDERSLAIRQQAGNATYRLYWALSTLALLIYAAMTAGQPGADPMLIYLAFMVLGPAVFYIVYVIWLHSHK